MRSLAARSPPDAPEISGPAPSVAPRLWYRLMAGVSRQQGGFWSRRATCVLWLRACWRGPSGLSRCKADAARGQGYRNFIGTGTRLCSRCQLAAGPRTGQMFSMPRSWWAGRRPWAQSDEARSDRLTVSLPTIDQERIHNITPRCSQSSIRPGRNLQTAGKPGRVRRSTPPHAFPRILLAPSALT